MGLRGAAYVRKVRSSNVKKHSESMAFLQENGFESREELDRAYKLSAQQLSDARDSLHETEESLAKTNRAIRASGAYLANRETWRAYKAAGDCKAFYAQHRQQLEACNAARRELKDLFSNGTAPSINELKAEKERFSKTRDAQYEAWTNARYRHRELDTARRNVEAILDAKQPQREAQRSRKEDTLQ